jgi:hypothetical protein
MSERSSSSSFAKRVVYVATVVGLVAGGCTQTRVAMVAKYQPGTPSRVDRAPEVGVYKIKYAAGPAGEEMHTLHGSKRLLGKGQPVGFVPGEDGQIIAVAGEERFPAMFPEGTRFCVWYTKSEEPSDFALGAGDAAHKLGVAAVIGAVGAVVVLGALDSLGHDHCRHGRDHEDCRRCRD